MTQRAGSLVEADVEHQFVCSLSEPVCDLTEVFISTEN